MKSFFTGLLLITGLLGFAQGENNNWYFGFERGLNFSTNPPTLLTTGVNIQPSEGVAAISSPEGDLLFYTNGNKVWNRDHIIMANGTDLAGNAQSQQVVILPHPGNDKLYYVFTMAYVWTGSLPGGEGSFSAYSVVDMTLGATGSDGFPLGDVVVGSKNTPLLDDSGNEFIRRSENVAATQHADNQSYWVLFPNNGHLYSYRLDSDGFHNDPVVSDLPAPVEPVETQMHIRVSPNLSPSLGLDFSNFICISRWPGGLQFTQNNYGIRVFSFDNATGLITNDYLLTSPVPQAYSSEFSSTGEILYLVNHNFQNVIAHDLLAGGFVDRLVYPGVSPEYLRAGSIQRAPNDEIYIRFEGSPTVGWGYLAMITDPDSFTASAVDRTGVFIDDNFNGWFGLPPLVPLLTTPGEGCYEHLTYSFPESGSVLHQAGSTITVTNNYKVSNGQDVQLKAGDMVTLEPNIYIEPGSLFLAAIDGCTPPMPRKAKHNNKPIRYIINPDVQSRVLSLYPNPSHDKVTVALPDGATTVTIYSADGKMVYSGAAPAEGCVIDVSAYAKGIYMINADSGDGSLWTGKLIRD